MKRMPRASQASAPRVPRRVVQVQEAAVEVHLCVPDEELHKLPEWRRAPMQLPADVPLPRRGEVIYLSSTSAWGVELVIHEWLSTTDLRVEVWLTHVGSARHRMEEGARIQ